MKKVITGKIEVGTKDVFFYDEKGKYITNLSTFLNDFIEELGYETSYASESSHKIDNVSISLFVSTTERTHEEMEETHIKDILGFEVDFNWEGYSEFTVLDFWIGSFTMGGHNLLKILNSYNGKWVSLVFRKVEKIRRDKNKKLYLCN